MTEERELNLKVKATADVRDLQEAVQATSSLLDQIKEAERLFKQHNQTSIQLKKAYKEFGSTGEYTADQLKEISAQIGNSQAEEQRQISTLRSLIEEYKQLGNATEEGGEGFKHLEQRISKAEGFITGITPAAKQAAAGMKRLGDEAQDSNQKLGRIEGTLADVRDELTSLASKAASGLATGIGVALVDQLQNAGQAVKDFVADSTENFEAFDEAKRRIFAQAPQLTDEFRAGLSEQADQISQDLGRVSEETLPAIRKALNLNVSEDNLMTELARASGVARTEAAGFQETLVLGLSTLRAYNGAIGDSTKVYDRLTFLVQNSNLELADLPGNFNGIVSAAGEAKVSIDDVVAAMITMNQQGDDITEIQDLLSNMFTQLQIEGTALGAAFKDAAGVGFKEYIAQGGNLVGALDLLQQHADKTGDSLLNLVGGSSPFFRDVQAARAVVELTGEKLDILRQYTDQVAESDGRAATAQREFADSTGFLRDQTEATTEVLQRQIGEALDPASRKWLDFKKLVVEIALAYNDLIGQANISTPTQIAFFPMLGGQSVDQVIEKTRNDVSKIKAFIEEANQNAEIAREQARIDRAFAEFASNAPIGVNVSTLQTDLNLYASAGETAESATTKLNAAMALMQSSTNAAADSVNVNRQNVSELVQEYLRLEDVTTAGARRTAGSRAGRAEGVREETEALKEQVEVIKALDGDTVRVAINGEIEDIRLVGVDTPETAKDWLHKAGVPFGDEALKFTQEFLMDPDIHVEITSDRRTYGRAIGRITNSLGQSLDEELTKAGLSVALPVEFTGSQELTDRLKELSTEAALAGRGFFENQEVVKAFFDGQINSQEDLIAAFEQSEQKWQSFMDAFRGSRSEWEQMAELQTAVANASKPDELAAAQEKLTAFNADLAASYQELALQQALSNVENADALETSLAYASSIGAITEAQAEWMAQQAEVKTGLAEIDEQLKSQKLTVDQAAEAFKLLTQGFVTNGTDAAEAARELENARDPYEVLANFAKTSGEGPRGAVETVVSLGDEVTTTAGLIGDMNAAALEFSTSAIDTGIEQIRVLEAAARGAAEQMAALISASGGAANGFGGGNNAPNPSQVGATPSTPAGSTNAPTINHNYNIGAVTDDALYQLKDQQKRAYDRYGVSGQ